MPQNEFSNSVLSSNVSALVKFCVKVEIHRKVKPDMGFFQSPCSGTTDASIRASEDLRSPISAAVAWYRVSKRGPDGHSTSRVDMQCAGWYRPCMLCPGRNYPVSRCPCWSGDGGELLSRSRGCATPCQRCE